MMKYMVVYKNTWGNGLTPVGAVTEEMTVAVAAVRKARESNPHFQYIILQGETPEKLEETFRRVAAGIETPRILSSADLDTEQAAQEPGGDHDKPYVYTPPFREYQMPKVSRLVTLFRKGELGGANDGEDLELDLVGGETDVEV
jgi:hypothetical protein